MITAINKPLTTAAKEVFESDLVEIKRLSDLIEIACNDIDCLDEKQIYTQMGKIQAYSYLLKRETGRL